MKLIFIIFKFLALIEFGFAFNWTNFEISRKTPSRILNGKQVHHEERFGYQVGVLLTDMESNPHWCGGSLISVEFVLTAAHCLKNMTGATVYLGTVNIRTPDPGAVILKVDKSNFLWHKDYNSQTLKNDIGLIKLPRPVEVTNTIKPIALVSFNPGRKGRFDGKLVRISGWGAVSNAGSTSDTLQYAIVEVLNQYTCQLFYGRLVSCTQICQSTTYDENDDYTDDEDNYKFKGICAGDSGGPMVANQNGEPVLIGIASFMKEHKCFSSAPRVFTRVSSYLQWIKNQISNMKNGIK